MTYKLCNNSQVRNFKQLTERFKRIKSEYTAVTYTKAKAKNDIEYYDNKLAKLSEEYDIVKARLERYVVVKHHLYAKFGNYDDFFCYRISHYNLEDDDYSIAVMFTDDLFGETLAYYQQKLIGGKGSKVRDAVFNANGEEYIAYEYYYRVN